MEIDFETKLAYICMAILLTGFIVMIPQYIFEFKQWREKHSKRATLSGKKILSEYNQIIRKMAPYEKRTIFLNDEHTQKCEMDIDVAVKRKCVYVNYIFDFMEEIPQLNAETDYSGEDDDINEDLGEMEDYDLVQRAAFIRLEECKDKLVITYFNHYEEEAYTWKFKTSMSQKKILSLFLNTDESCNIEDDGPDLTTLGLVKDVITGEISKLDENPFGWR